MDDMVLQYNNQNSIYVLNSNYNGYGEFSHLNLIDPIGSQLGTATISNHHHDERAAQNCRSAASRSCASSVSRTLQHKLRTLGNFNGNATTMGVTAAATEAIGNAVTATAASGTTSCSPAAAAIQKLFNCSSSNINSVATPYNNNNNNNNRDRDCLSVMEKENGVIDGSITRGLTGVCGAGNAGGGASGGKKKCSNVKSTLIAKKTKFWKFLEEEKWRLNDDANNENNNTTTTTNDNYVTSNGSECHAVTLTSSSVCRDNSSDKKLTTDATTRTNTTNSNANGNANGNDALHYNKGHYGTATSSPYQNERSNNWSGNRDSNNQHAQQQRQQYTMKPQRQKSSYELYKEAAELLGLSCSLCDNCRCLDCQSGYFDCDDSDSYSELSLMDEYDVDDEEEEEYVGINTAATVMTMPCYENTTSTTSPDYCCASTATHCECTAADCSLDETDATSPHANATASSDAARHQDTHLTATSTMCHQQQQQQHREHEQQQDSNDGCNELENCASFNGLSLADATAQQQQRQQQREMILSGGIQ